MKRSFLFSNLMAIAFCFIGCMKIFAIEPDFRDGNLYYKVSNIEKRECYVYGPVSNDVINKLVVPSTAQYKGVVFDVVGVWKLDNKSSSSDLSRFRQVVSIDLPNSVKIIEKYAFKECKLLTSIRMEGIEIIEYGAFAGCKNLRSIGTFKNLKYLNYNSFAKCGNIEKVVIPPSCSEIDTDVFESCNSPQCTITIEDGETPLMCSGNVGKGRKIYIGRNIFSQKRQDWLGEDKYEFDGNVYYFNEVDYGDNVTEMLCVPLDNPYNVETVQYLTIGASIKEIPDFSKDGIGLKSIHMVSKIPPTFQTTHYGNEGSFNNYTYLNCTLYVPTGSLDAYRNASVWKNFFDIQEYESERTKAAARKLSDNPGEREEERIYAIGNTYVVFTVKAPKRVKIGEPFKISFSVNQQGCDFYAPQFTDFDVLSGPHISSTNSTRYVNGQRSTTFEQTYIYKLKARRAGTFTISPATIKVKGKDVQSNGVLIEVQHESE